MSQPQLPQQLYIGAFIEGEWFEGYATREDLAAWKAHAGQVWYLMDTPTMACVRAPCPTSAPQWVEWMPAQHQHPRDVGPGFAMHYPGPGYQDTAPREPMPDYSGPRAPAPPGTQKPITLEELWPGFVLGRDQPRWINVDDLGGRPLVIGGLSGSSGARGNAPLPRLDGLPRLDVPEDELRWEDEFGEEDPAAALSKGSETARRLQRESAEREAREAGRRAADPAQLLDFYLNRGLERDAELPQSLLYPRSNGLRRRGNCCCSPRGTRSTEDP